MIETKEWGRHGSSNNSGILKILKNFNIAHKNATFTQGWVNLAKLFDFVDHII